MAKRAQATDLVHEATRLSRRQLLGRGAGGLAAATSLSAFIAACGGSDSGSSSSSDAPAQSGPTPASQVTGSLVLMSYPDWYGPKEFADFRAKYPGASVRDVASGSGAAEQIVQLARKAGDFDLTLAALNVAEQLKQADLLEPLNASAVPNLASVGPEFTEVYPYGIPTDFGRTGFGYRSDLIEERPTTWQELFALMRKYPGKTTMIKYDADIQGMALKALGHSINTQDGAQLDAMQKLLLSLKPNLRSIIDTDFSKDLVAGDAFFAIDYDYDIAAAQQDNDDIVWVQPEEGVPAYLEGWAALKGSEHKPAVWALMDFHLQPRNYASFINTTGAAYTVPKAEPYIKRSIAGSEVLKYTPENLKAVEFEKYLGSKQTLERGKLWQAFLAA